MTSTNSEIQSDVWDSWMKFPVNYNKAGSTEAQKWPDLIGGPKTFSVSTEKSAYTISIAYNMMTKWPGVLIYNNDLQKIQGWTRLAPFPSNLLVAFELKDYGLFYIPSLDSLFFRKLPANWYNTDIHYDDMLNYLTYNRIVGDNQDGSSSI